MTDTELDALQAKLARQVTIKMCREAVDAIAALREQVAAKEKLAQSYYNEASDGWTIVRKLEADNAALRKWIDNNMTHYNTAEAGARPILAEFGKRVWYHVTDDETHFPFSAVIDAARNTE